MRALVHTPQGLSGRILKDRGEYFFSFDPRATPVMEPSLTMPLRAKPYQRATLHPVFQMNLPEGFVLEQIRLRLAKAGANEPLLLLNVIGKQAPIGRLRYSLDGEAAPGAAFEQRPGEHLADLLASRGSKVLFARLVDDYVLSSGLSGVQPKVIVPEAVEKAADIQINEKAVLATRELIVKSGLDIFPGLSINEFFCMSVIKCAGIEVPEFFLSQDGELFVMRRFDRPPDGRILGFEDMLALAGREPSQKYEGSYAMILKLLRLYCSPARMPQAARQLFDMLALSCILGNGDAHMKNFGVLYDDVYGEVSMAPAYDIACTRLYIPEDSLALTLDGNKAFFAARQGLLDFGKTCGMTATAVATRLIELAQLTLDMLEEMADTVARLAGLREAIEPEARRYLSTFKKSR